MRKCNGRKRSQFLPWSTSRTASAIFMIAAEDISQSGAKNIPDLLADSPRDVRPRFLCRVHLAILMAEPGN
jgi:hypothetical protein